MIRVAVVIEALGRGGAERLLVDTARGLDPSQFSISVYTLFPARRDYSEALREIGIKETCLGVSRRWAMPRAVLRLHSLLRESPPNLVHTHLFAANIVGRLAARLAGRPLVSTYHDADYEPVVRLGNPGLTAAKQRLLQALDAATVKLTGPRLVAVSEYVARSVRTRLRAGCVSVIPNAVDTHVFRPDAGIRIAMRSRLGLSPSERVVICIGRMTPQKGQDTLLRAMTRVKAAVKDSHLLLVGDGAWREHLASLVKGLALGPHVSFLGNRSDVPDLLRTADVLALPSLHEGFGLVLIEALATGVPVVASRIGPVSEIVDDGLTGLLVPPTDANALADGIIGVLSDRDRWQRMSRCGRSEAEDRFDLPRMLDATARLYADVAAVGLR